jgi:hypothetical protein
MEPITWILLGGALVFGGFQLFNKDEVDQQSARAEMVTESSNTIQAEQAAVMQRNKIEADGGFERGVYFRSKHGYMISNLSAPKKRIDGCDKPILVTNLTSPINGNEGIQVTEINVLCDEEG